MTKILSQKEAVNFAEGKNVLLMNSPIAECDSTAAERVNRIREIAADCLYLEFHDINGPKGTHLVHPKVHHVESALEWAKNKDLSELICVCQMGVSRSSAMAYILNCAVVQPSEAIKVLDVNIHVPNLLIVAIGSELIGREGKSKTIFEENGYSMNLNRYNPENEKSREIMRVYREFIFEIDMRFMDEVPLEIMGNP